MENITDCNILDITNYLEIDAILNFYFINRYYKNLYTENEGIIYINVIKSIGFKIINYNDMILFDHGIYKFLIDNTICNINFIFFKQLYNNWNSWNNVIIKKQL